MVLGAGVNLAVDAELHYVIGNHARLFVSVLPIPSSSASFEMHKRS